MSASVLRRDSHGQGDSSDRVESRYQPWPMFVIHAFVARALVATLGRAIEMPVVGAVCLLGLALALVLPVLPHHAVPLAAALSILTVELVYAATATDPMSTADVVTASARVVLFGAIAAAAVHVPRLILAGWSGRGQGDMRNGRAMATCDHTTERAEQADDPFYVL